MAVRDGYREVGAATRQALERAMPGLTLREARVLLAAIWHLTTWSRLTDHVSIGQLAQLANMDVRHTTRAVQRLAARGVLHYTPGGSPKGGRRVPSRISLPPATVAPGTPPATVAPGTYVPPATVNTDPRPPRTPTPGHGGPPSEKYPEKTPEKNARGSSESEPQALDGMEPPPTASGPADVARAILADWWEHQTPRPQQPFPAALKVAAKALRDGWTVAELGQALDEVPVISGGALEYWRRRHSSNGSNAKSAEQVAAESLARIKRTMGLDQ